MKLKKALLTGSVMAVLVLGAGAFMGSGAFDSNFSCTSKVVTDKVTAMQSEYIKQQAFTSIMFEQADAEAAAGQDVNFFLNDMTSDQFNAVYNKLASEGNSEATALKKIMAAAQIVTGMVTFTGWGEIKGAPHNENTLNCSGMANFKTTSTPFGYKVTHTDKEIMVYTNPNRDLRSLF